MQIWNLEDLLQCSGNNLKSEGATVENDSDEMDMDTDVNPPPKLNKGIGIVVTGISIYM